MFPVGGVTLHMHVGWGIHAKVKEIYHHGRGTEMNVRSGCKEGPGTNNSQAAKAVNAGHICRWRRRLRQLVG
jgi:hypothetical protein